MPLCREIEHRAVLPLVTLPDGARRAFSFASAPPLAFVPPPPAGQTIELHVRLIPGGPDTTHVFERMQVGDAIEFEGPVGRFAPSTSSPRPMTLYSGVRTAADLYLLDQVHAWEREHANFRFVPVLLHADDDASWTGRRGLVHEAMLADHPNLSGYEVYACGSVKMVEAAVPDFLAHGLGEQFCFSDAFVPSKPAGAAA